MKEVPNSREMKIKLRNTLFVLGLLILSTFTMSYVNAPVEAQTAEQCIGPINPSADTMVAHAMADADASRLEVMAASFGTGGPFRRLSYGHGGGEFVFYVTTPSGDVDVDSLLSLVKFDLSAIPTGATIMSATYTFQGRGGVGGPPLLTLYYPLLEDWDELSVTWNTKPSAGSLTDGPYATNLGTPPLNSHDLTNTVRFLFDSGRKIISFQKDTQGAPTLVRWTSREGEGYGGYGIAPTLTVCYTLPTQFITVTSDHGSPTASAWVNSGSDFTASVTSPDVVAPGHQWVCTGYSVDGGASQAGTSYEFTSVQAAHTIVFSWQEEFYLTMQVSPSGGGSTTPTSGWQNAGSSVTISATPASGYTFSSWSGSGSDSCSGPTNPSSVAMNGPITETANFATAAVQTATGTGTAIFSSDAGLMQSLTAVSESSLPSSGRPTGLVFPHGFFSFTISGLEAGATVTVTITLPSPLASGSFSYWKFQGGAWIQMPSSKATLDSSRTVITLTLTDGASPDDADGSANGVIVDPGGPAVPTSPPVQIAVGGEILPINQLHVLLPWLALVAVLGVVAVETLVVRRRKKN